MLADTPVGCDEGWVDANNYCYLFYNTRRVTWQQAANECNRYDSSLVFFDNMDEEVIDILSGGELTLIKYFVSF